MLDVKKFEAAIEKNSLVSINIEKEDFNDILIDATAILAKQVNKICFLSLSKPYRTIVDLLSKNKIPISKFFFIDTLSSTVSNPGKVDNCVFIDSPNDLTSINLAISESIKFGCDVIMIDSITILIIYNDINDVIKFANSLFTKIRTADRKAIIITFKGEEKNELEKDLYKFVDITI